MVDTANEKIKAKMEGAVIVACLVVLLLGLAVSGGYARRERRDGKVRDELRSMKTAIEMYFNEYEKYPSEWKGGKYKYQVTQRQGEDATGWYVSGVLENAPEPTGGFDEEYNIDWRVTAEGR